MEWKCMQYFNLPPNFSNVHLRSHRIDYALTSENADDSNHIITTNLQRLRTSQNPNQVLQKINMDRNIQLTKHQKRDMNINYKWPTSRVHTDKLHNANSRFVDFIPLTDSISPNNLLKSFVCQQSEWVYSILPTFSSNLGVSAVYIQYSLNWWRQYHSRSGKSSSSLSSESSCGCNKTSHQYMAILYTHSIRTIAWLITAFYMTSTEFYIDHLPRLLCLAY